MCNLAVKRHILVRAVARDPAKLTTARPTELDVPFERLTGCPRPTFDPLIPEAVKVSAIWSPGRGTFGSYPRSGTKRILPVGSCAVLRRALIDHTLEAPKVPGALSESA